MIEIQSRTSCEDLIKEKDKEIESLREHTSNQDRIIAEANNRIYKAIEKAEQMLKTYYESNMANDMKNISDLLKILKGE